MEGLHLMKDILQERDYMCTIDLRNAFFTIPVNQKYRKNLMFKWEGPCTNFLPLLRTRPSTSDIYKINEGPYFCTAAPKHLPNNIPGRRADNGHVSTGIDLSSRHCDLPA